MTAHDDKSEMLKQSLLAMGAGNYIQKPFNQRELQQNVQRLLSPPFRTGRARSGEEDVLRIGKIRIEPDKRKVWVDKKSMHLSPLLFDLLCELARSKEGVTREELLRTLAFRSDNPDAVKEAVSRLKKIIGADSIVAIRSGYQLVG